MSGDDFDADALAAVAEGRDVGTSAGGADPAPEADDAGSSDDSESSSSSRSSTGRLAGLVLPLFVAGERGPSADRFAERGIGEGLANVLDGVTDYVLDLVGKDPGDSLGPVGKIGIGLSQMDGLDFGSVTSSTNAGDDGDDDGDDGAADMGGVPAA